ncbi:MAG: zinc-binding dehydrogenase [Gemmatimonadales bacterium]|nr:zinc-binding dehydrogenase [Gemmatimonadales bacterium]
MRSAVIAGPKTARLERVPIPDPGGGEIRVRLEGCGVCGSNLPFWEGRSWFSYPGEPGAPGHEGWGVVDAVGEGVTGLAPGDRVATLSTRAFAEYDLVSADSAVALPPRLAGRPFPGEPLACAMNAFRRAEVRRGQAVVVVGVGFLGALLIGLAASAGARVIAISRRPYALAMAEALGADVTIALGDHGPIVNRIHQLTDGEGADRVLEVVGLQESLDLAGKLTRVRGRLVIAGYHQDGPRTVDMQLWNWRGLDVVNAHERDPAVYVQGMREAVAAIAEGRLDPFSLFTHRFPLDDLGAAMEAMRTRPEGFMKALVVT